MQWMRPSAFYFFRFAYLVVTLVMDSCSSSSTSISNDSMPITPARSSAVWFGPFSSEGLRRGKTWTCSPRVRGPIYSMSPSSPFLFSSSSRHAAHLFSSSLRCWECASLPAASSFISWLQTAGSFSAGRTELWSAPLVSGRFCLVQFPLSLSYSSQLPCRALADISLLLSSHRPHYEGDVVFCFFRFGVLHGSLLFAIFPGPASFFRGVSFCISSPVLLVMFLGARLMSAHFRFLTFFAGAAALLLPSPHVEALCLTVPLFFIFLSGFLSFVASL